MVVPSIQSNQLWNPWLFAVKYRSAVRIPRLNFPVYEDPEGSEQKCKLLDGPTCPRLHVLTWMLLTGVSGWGIPSWTLRLRYGTDRPLHCLLVLPGLACPNQLEQRCLGCVAGFENGSGTEILHSSTRKPENSWLRPKSTLKKRI